MQPTNKTPFLCLLLFFSCAFIQPTEAQPIDEGKYISIGGIEQWITIKGEDRSNPVILFLHGGPGSTFNPFADNVFKDWEKDFVLVQWDQRGAGRTYGKNAPEEQTEDFIVSNPLTIDQIASDGIEVAEYLLSHLNKEKVILTASSWGSGLGVKMATQRPDLFYAYIGHAQLVNPTKELVTSYQQVLQMAKKANDEKSLSTLEEIGPPPYDHPRKLGQLNRVIKHYEALNSTPAPESWWQWTAEYDNEQDKKWRFEGDDYSFTYYAGFEKMGLASMAKEIHFMDDGYQFQIPVFLIQGKHDILTPESSTRPYFEKIEAPKKEYFLLPNSAHDFSEEMMEMEWKVLTEYVLPVVEE